MYSSVSRHKYAALFSLAVSLAVLSTAFRVTADTATFVSLTVPYVSQVPDGKWIDPWDESCEEASTVMIDRFYQGYSRFPTVDAKRDMQQMIDWEKEHFELYTDINAEETVRLINEHTRFRATIQRFPLVEDIKSALRDGRPVMAFVNMFELYRERNLGDSFHIIVVIGFDDVKKEFIVHDPARKEQRYPYTILMNALHDYQKTTREGDGDPTVIFTQPPALRSSGLINWLTALFLR